MMDIDGMTSFYKLPKELIVKIFRELEPSDRLSFSSVNKTLTNHYRNGMNYKFNFYIRGYTEQAAIAGFVALSKSPYEFDTIRIFNLDLAKAFGHFAETQRIQPRLGVTTVTIRECILSDQVMRNLRRLLPDMRFLELIRVCFVKTSSVYREDEISHLEKVTLTLPVVAPDAGSVSYCLTYLEGGKSNLQLLNCPFSKKRSIVQRFNKQLKRRPKRGRWIRFFELEDTFLRELSKFHVVENPLEELLFVH